MAEHQLPKLNTGVRFSSSALSKPPDRGGFQGGSARPAPQSVPTTCREHADRSVVMARARSFGNIRQLPSGPFQGRYWDLSKQIPAEVAFATKSDAPAWLQCQWS